MKLRFLTLTPSDNPEYPFQAGQVIDVPKLTATMKRWLKDGQAIAVAESSEAAVVADPERAVLGGVERR